MIRRINWSKEKFNLEKVLQKEDFLVVENFPGLKIEEIYRSLPDLFSLGIPESDFDEESGYSDWSINEKKIRSISICSLDNSHHNWQKNTAVDLLVDLLKKSSDYVRGAGCFQNVSEEIVAVSMYPLDLDKHECANLEKGSGISIDFHSRKPIYIGGQGIVDLKLNDILITPSWVKRYRQGGSKEYILNCDFRQPFPIILG